MAVVAAVGVLFVDPSRAQARAESVGGGAAGVEVFAMAATAQRLRVTGVRGAYGRIAHPAVELPWYGSEGRVLQADALTGTGLEASSVIARAVSARGLHVSTTGNLEGTPYAESTASVARLWIQGTDIRAVATRCRWDTAGVTASTTITDAAGNVYEPPVNTRIDVPGLGAVVLNEQVRNVLHSGAEVISVRGIHVYGGHGNDASQAQFEVGLAFSSCDPLSLPGLIGAGLLGSVSPGPGSSA